MATTFNSAGSLAVRVEAASPLPGGTMAGPYPGQLLLGYLLTDHRSSTHVLKIKHSGGRLRLEHGGEEQDAVPPTWLAYVAAARDRHEQTMEALRDSRGLVYYRTVRDIKPGEELAVWYGDELARDAGIPILSPANIRGNQEYSCTRCGRAFQYPNTLKAHMRFHCQGLRVPSSLHHPTEAASSVPLHSATSSAFTPISRPDLKEDSKHTPPKDSIPGLPRTLFPDPPSPTQLQMLLAQNPLLLRYYMQYPSPLPVHPQLLHAYKSLYSGQMMVPPPSSHPSPVSMPVLPSRGMSPPEHSPPGGSSGSMMASSYFPMPSEKDGEPLDLLPKSLYMNKSRKGHLCIYCGKLYSRKYGLKIHLRTHTGYKPLKCKVCLRPFGDPSNLNKHIRLHAEGETPYRCDYCGKVLVRRRDLERHVKSRHPNELRHFESKTLANDLQNKSVDIDANEHVDESDETDPELDLELEDGLCEEDDDEIEVD